MPLLSLPVELIFEVADYLDPKDVSSLILTSKALHRHLINYLYRLARFYKRRDNKTLTVELYEISFWFDKIGSYSILEWACVHRVWNTFERLLKEPGVDLLLRDSYNVTLLHRLATHDMTQYIAPLITQLQLTNQNPFGKDSSGLTPLHYAAGRDQINAVQLLIKSGADVSAHDHHKNTPLHIAAVSGSCNVLRTLINAGADVHAKTRFGWTAIDQASVGRKDNVVTLLLQLGSKLPGYENRPNYLEEFVFLSPRPLNCYSGSINIWGSTQEMPIEAYQL